MDLIDVLRAFVATAETGSFTAAAERLRISNRLTSKYVADLEARLGVRLLQRTTRRVGLTSAGEALLTRAPALLDDLDELLADITEDKRGFSGTIRVSAPFVLGGRYVQDMLSRFAETHPNLTIDLRLNDAYIDLAAEGFDLAFRIGDTAIPSLKRRKLGEICSVLVASPEYLADHPEPMTPEALRDHVCIVDTNNTESTRWTFLNGRERLGVPVETRFMVNSAEVVRDLALRGRGIAYGPLLVVKDDIQAGRLIRLLVDHETPRHSLSVVYLGGRTLPRKIRALIDFTVDDIRHFGLV